MLSPLKPWTTFRIRLKTWPILFLLAVIMIAGLKRLNLLHIISPLSSQSKSHMSGQQRPSSFTLTSIGNNIKYEITVCKKEIKKQAELAYKNI